jgi:hypothetical protein
MTGTKPTEAGHGTTELGALHGMNVGLKFSPGGLVSRKTFDPSEFIRKICSLPPRIDVNAILCPSRLNRGNMFAFITTRCPSGQLVTRAVCDPSAFITQICRLPPLSGWQTYAILRPSGLNTGACLTGGGAVNRWGGTRWHPSRRSGC